MTASETASLFPDALMDAARLLLDDAATHGLMLATAESCTGGLVAGLLTEIPGSSAVVDRGLVTYSNEAKSEVLGVPAALIAEHGAVSAPVARAMAEGALAASRADIAVSLTGIAGPDGGSMEKPVGLVWFAVAKRGGETAAFERVFDAAGRTAVRLDAVCVAVALLQEAVTASAL